VSLTMEGRPADAATARPFHDLREWLRHVEALGQLKTERGVDTAGIAEATDVLQHTPQSPCVLFDDIADHAPGFRMVVATLTHTDRVALTLGLPLGMSKTELAQAWRRRLKTISPLPAVEVTDAPIFENVQRGADVDVTVFPAPQWHPADGGRYLGTGSYDITRDPDEGWVNLGTYRVMVHGPDRLGYYISPGKHGRIHRQKYFDRGEPCPVAMVFGGDPLLFLAAQMEVPYGITEYDWVGGVRGEPMRVVRGPITGLPLPADAEIVVEGFATQQEQIVEGPFGEWTGYYGSASRHEPVLKVEAVYHRNNPIVVGAPPGQPPDELSRYRAILRSAQLVDDVERAGVPDVVAGWQHEVGGTRLFTVIAIKQRYPGHARQALHIASQCRAAAYAGRYVIVVDDDVDPANLEEVIWAMCTRSDPAESIDIIRRAWSTPLDPRIGPAQRAARDFTNSRALIDATRPWEWRDEFPPINVPLHDVRAAAHERWRHLLES
jgi:UbiD family decarboxylase